MKTLPALFLALLPALAGAQTKLAFVPLDEPCRLLDTRTTPPGALLPGVVYPVQAVDSCGIPFGAKAIEANLTVTNTAGPGYLAVMRPTGRIPATPEPKTSVLNFGAGQTVANAALIMLGAAPGGGHGWDSSFWLVAGGSGADVVVDVSGYYVVQP